jgi:hypothetical protein
MQVSLIAGSRMSILRGDHVHHADVARAVRSLTSSRLLYLNKQLRFRTC